MDRFEIGPDVKIVGKTAVQEAKYAMGKDERPNHYYRVVKNMLNHHLFFQGKGILWVVAAPKDQVIAAKKAWDVYKQKK